MQRFAVVRDMFPNGTITVHCEACCDAEERVNVHVEKYGTLTEALAAADTLEATEVNGTRGRDCPHCKS